MKKLTNQNLTRLSHCVRYLKGKTHVKPDKPKQFGRWLIPASVVVVVTASAIGFLVDTRGFLGNLLSETAGIFASIIIALLIVDRYTEHQKEQQWAKVRDLTYAAIVGHLCDLAIEMLLHFPVKDHRLMTPISEGRDRPNPETKTAMTNLALLLRQLPNPVSNEKSTSDLAVEFYEKVKWDLDQIQYVLTPRVVQSSADQQVINALVEFDNARRKLHNAIIVHKEISIPSGVLPAVIELLEKTQDLYGAICEEWR